MSFIKEDKKIVMVGSKSSAGEGGTMTHKNTVYKTQSPPQYLSYESICDIYNELQKHETNISISNKSLFILIKHKLIYEKHIKHHFINFCHHISYKLSSYKSQDREKSKGDFEIQVIKDNYILNKNCTNYDNLKIKKIHTDSYNYIDQLLYENKYFNIYSFLKLFVYSKGMCFYCERMFDITLTERFMACSFNNCIFNKNIVNIKTHKQTIHDSSKQFRWSLERINNKLGHYQTNCILACLKCNLKRRTKNHQSFKFTQTLTIYKKD